jgi:hypothetical protein
LTKDPDFDASQSAFYCARVLEIPTPRWTAFDAKFFKIQMPKEVPMKQQERAYTSQIWYTPLHPRTERAVAPIPPMEPQITGRIEFGPRRL